MLYTVNEKGEVIEVQGVVPDNVMKREFVLSQDMGNARAGERIMMAVTPADVAQITELENYLGGFTNGEDGLDVITQPIPVEKETFKRRDFSVYNAFAPVADDVGREGAIKQIEHTSATVQNTTSEHALAAFIPFATENDAVSTFDVRAAHLDMIGQKLRLNRAIRWWGKLTTTGNWDSSTYTSLTTNYKWDNGSTKSVFNDIGARIEASWQPINGIFFNPTVCRWAIQDATMVAMMRQRYGDNAPQLADSLIHRAEALNTIQTFQLPGLPPFYVIPAKKYVSSAMSYILGKSVVFASIPKKLTGGATMGTALTFRYRGRSGTGWTVNEYIPYGRGLNGGTMLEAGFADAEVMPSTFAGGLIDAVIS